MYENEDAEGPIVAGERFRARDEVRACDFTAPAEPGEDFFRCDVQPAQMSGTFVVRG